MREQLVLTCDLGTTRLKVAAFTLRGGLVGQTSRRNPEFREGEHSWQEADGWWRDCMDATRQLLTENTIEPAQIIGIGLSGRAGAAVFLDQEGAVIEDPWLDHRHGRELQEIFATFDGIPNYAATLIAKSNWLEANKPHLASEVIWRLYAKDFLLFRMTGVAVTDPASGPDGEWDSGWLSAANIAPDQVPAVKLPWTIAGTLTKVAARELGLTEDTPVAVGAHDGICANTGAGAITEGTMAITLGTNCVARMVMRQVPAGSMRFYGYPQDLHVIGGNALMAGRSLDWFLDIAPDVDKKEANRRQLFRTMDHAISDMNPGAGGVMFLPHLGGQLSPTRRPKAKALFYGMDANTTHATMYRAVLEGVNMAIADVVDQVVSWCGAPSRIGVTGSGMQSEVWTHMLADILGRPLELTDVASEGRGAAIFCATALGHYPSLKDATANMVNVTRTIEPDEGNAHAYRELRLRWQSLQDLTRPLDGI